MAVATTDQDPSSSSSSSSSASFCLFSLSTPHILSFHLAWLSLFTSYLSAFTAPTLLPVLRQTLALTASDASHAAVAFATGTIFGRLLTVPACNLLGPRHASATSSLLLAPAVFLLASLASSPASFLLLRFLTGLSLASLVANQLWVTSMFSPSVVGLANAVAAGWGSLGCAAAQFLMPIVFSAILTAFCLPESQAWRAAFLVPTSLQVLAALAVMAYGSDFPDPKARDIRGDLADGLLNYRGWVLGLTYGFCFAVEMTMDNIAVEYMYDRFGLGMEAAGVVAAGFGVVNVAARPGGAMVSDEMGRRFGMRGRLWGLWVVQTVGGVLCVVMGRMAGLTASVAVMIAMSVFVRAATGMTFGVVPFVSKRWASFACSSLQENSRLATDR